MADDDGIRYIAADVAWVDRPAGAALATDAAPFAYNPDQERDERGQWAPAGDNADGVLTGWQSTTVDDGLHQAAVDAYQNPVLDTLDSAPTVEVSDTAPAVEPSNPAFNDFDLDRLGAMNEGWDGSTEDAALAAMWDARGFSGIPTVVSPDEFEQATEGMTVLYRGISGPTPQVAESYAEQLRSGSEPFVGCGAHGNGTYTSTDPEAARYYASWDESTGSRSEGTTVRMALPADAKTVTVAEIDAARDEWKSSWSDRISTASAQERPALEGQRNRESVITEDPGRLATALGYQAITQPEAGFAVIQDRSVLIVEAAGG